MITDGMGVESRAEVVVVVVERREGGAAKDWVEECGVGGGAVGASKRVESCCRSCTTPLRSSRRLATSARAS